MEEMERADAERLEGEVRESGGRDQGRKRQGVRSGGRGCEIGGTETGRGRAEREIEAGRSRQMCAGGGGEGANGEMQGGEEKRRSLSRGRAAY